MNTHDELTRQLGDRLRDEVSGVGSSTITLDDVRGTATRIRRRRRAAVAGAGVAAVIALAVPTAIGGGFLESAPAPGPVEPGPSIVETPNPPQAIGGALDTAGLPLGEPAQIPWLEDGRVLHQPGVPPLELDGTYTSVVTWRGIDGSALAGTGWLAGDMGVWHLLDPSTGERTGRSLTGIESLVVSDDRDRLLFVQDGALRRHDNVTGETATLREGLAGTVQPIGVSDGGVAHYNVTADDGSTTAYRLADGEEQVVDPGTPMFAWNDVSDEGWTLAMTEIDELAPGSCSRVAAPSGGVTGESCEFSLDAVSPDTEHVLAGPAYRSGYGDAQLAVVRTVEPDGEPVLEFVQRGPDDATFMGARWEDEDSVLVVTATPISGTADKTWQLLRVNLDGTVENVTEPVRGGEMAFPFALLP